MEVLTIPLPPLAEQEQIVAEVERRLSVIGELEQIVADNLKRAERLRQSILREAFAGRLVPQDPTDEPASALLERIQQERKEQTPTNNRKRDKQETSREGIVVMEKPADVKLISEDRGQDIWQHDLWTHATHDN